MNKRRLALWGLLLALLLCAVMTGACAQQAVTDQTVYALLPGETEPIRVNSTLITNADTEETQRWLFLPAFADLNALRLFAGGQACRAEWSQVEEAGALGCELPGGCCFTPNKVKYLVEGLADNLGDAWDQYYWEFIDVGVDEGWTRLYSAVFRP